MVRLKTKIFIRGNYGFGNLGDDILMLSIANIVQNICSPEDITIEVENPKIAKKWIKNVNFVQYGQFKEICSIIEIYGGGGQFFYFQENKGIKKQLVRVKRFLTGELKFNQIGKYIQSSKIKTRSEIHSKYKIAIGLGIGPFSGNNKKSSECKNKLQSCSYISVRDDGSKSICDSFNVKKSVKTSDLAFLHEFGIKTNINKCNKNTIGLILRFWSYNNYGKDVLGKLQCIIKHLKSTGFNVLLISLSKIADEIIINKFKNSVDDVFIWDNSTKHPNSFLREVLDKVDLVISMRAHGIIIPSIYGIPSICIDIEPKIKNIHAMFPKGTYLWTVPYKFEDLYRYIDSIYSNKNHIINYLFGESEMQKNLAENDRQFLQNFISNKIL